MQNLSHYRSANGWSNFTFGVLDIYENPCCHAFSNFHTIWDKALFKANMQVQCILSWEHHHVDYSSAQSNNMLTVKEDYYLFLWANLSSELKTGEGRAKLCVTSCKDHLRDGFSGLIRCLVSNCFSVVF